jgi:hypothetical protein
MGCCVRCADEREGIGRDLFCETSGIAGFWECGLHLLVLNERCDEVARICVVWTIFMTENANKDSP